MLLIFLERGELVNGIDFYCTLWSLTSSMPVVRSSAELGLRRSHSV